jgi:chorismate mutase / prephenate dehydratase
MEDKEKLAELRTEIDTIDRELLELLNKRAQFALQARIAKGGKNIYRPEREEEILRAIASKNKGPLSDEAVRTMFQSIIYVCRAIQEVEVKK